MTAELSYAVRPKRHVLRSRRRWRLWTSWWFVACCTDPCLFFMKLIDKIEIRCIFFERDSTQRPKPLACVCPCAIHGCTSLKNGTCRWDHHAIEVVFDVLRFSIPHSMYNDNVRERKLAKDNSSKFLEQDRHTIEGENVIPNYLCIATWCKHKYMWLLCGSYVSVYICG